MSDVAKLVPTKSDQEKANEYKQRAIEASQEFMKVMTEASKEGFKFQIGFGEDAFGKVVITQFGLFKAF